MKRKPLKRGNGFKRSGGFKRKKHIDPTGKYNNMMDFFREVWDSRCDANGWCTDFEDGTPLRPELRETSITFHHLVWKSVNKDLAYEPQNIVLLTANNHNKAHNNLESMPKVKAETDRIFNLYKNNEL